MRGRVEGRGGAPHEAWLTVDGERYAAALGARGVVRHKEEGDGGTPAGILPVRRVLYRADRLAPPSCAVPREPLAPQDGWCDAPDDPSYNRPVGLPHGARCEALWREDGLYDVIGVLGHNDDPVVRGAGSAIFLHVAPKGGAATKGCVGLALPDLLRVLAMGLSEIEVV